MNLFAYLDWISWINSFIQSLFNIMLNLGNWLRAPHWAIKYFSDNPEDKLPTYVIVKSRLYIVQLYDSEPDDIPSERIFSAKNLTVYSTSPRGILFTGSSESLSERREVHNTLARE